MAVSRFQVRLPLSIQTYIQYNIDGNC